ncbi:monoheme c-type cytochrome [Campylobacter iguaniorum]|uniref:Monoheme c-type cytochrome n=1 Tax=Campylobacter iguaniorum TaxID=1244531 RepID=A0A076FF08_9BACT|nr:c-type cytochrome [Campylobacter iguaniorum]AII14414.1 monoheme c-type cytochrome [Campylobacter iguaniorum]ALV24149.1 monoheme c-type cytochrome [Campylobacter iguaniorum]
MNTGKIVAGTLGGVVVLLMVYLMASGDSTPVAAKQEVAKQAATPVAQPKQEEGFQTSSELNKIKELKQSVTITNDGVSKLYLRSCAPCHGKDGKGILAPDITGKNKEAILASLHDYKADKIPNSLMKGLLTNVSDENLTQLADEIANFK